MNCTATVNGRARRTSVRTEAAKRITVLESPKCLFVHLKRAKYSQQVGQEKITCHVDFPQSLNLGPYMTHADKENNPEYLLRAVVVHHGKHFASGTLNYIFKGRPQIQIIQRTIKYCTKMLIL